MITGAFEEGDLVIVTRKSYLSSRALVGEDAEQTHQYLMLDDDDNVSKIIETQTPGIVVSVVLDSYGDAVSVKILTSVGTGWIRPESIVKHVPGI